MQIHATTDAAGVPFAVLAGQEFTTYWLKIADEDDAEHYGAAIGDVIAIQRGHLVNALQCYGPEDLDRFLIQAVEVEDPPAGQEIAKDEMGAELFGLAVDEEGVITASPTFTLPPLPAEVPMWKVRGWLAREGKLATVKGVLASVPNADEAQEIFASAPNLVVTGDMAQVVKAALSYDDGQYADAIRGMCAYTA